MNPLDRFDPVRDKPKDFLERLRAKQRERDRETERREAIRRNQDIARIQKAKAADAAQIDGIRRNQSPPITKPKNIVPPIGSGRTVPTPAPQPRRDPFGLDTLRYHLAEAKKETQKLRDAADAVLAIHKKVEDKREGRDFCCGYCSTPYPCVTVEALLGDSE